GQIVGVFSGTIIPVFLDKVLHFGLGKFLIRRVALDGRCRKSDRCFRRLPFLIKFKDRQVALQLWLAVVKLCKRQDSQLGLAVGVLGVKCVVRGEELLAQVPQSAVLGLAPEHRQVAGDRVSAVRFLWRRLRHIVIIDTNHLLILLGVLVFLLLDD